MALERIPIQLAILDRALDMFLADVLVDGAFPFASRLLAELRGIPRASLFAGCFPIPTEAPLFPHGPGIPPPTDDAGKNRARLLRALVRVQERSQVETWDAIRQTLGLQSVGLHPWRAPASSDLVLLPTAPAFEYPRPDLPQQFWFVGPLLWQTRWNTAMPERVAKMSRDGDPIVYVSQGATYNTNPIIIKLTIEALRSEPVRVLATVVRPFAASEFGALPSNTIVERFVPFTAILDNVSVVVTHAGAGTVHAALSHGIPLLGLPFTADQFEVAARISWSGAGLRLDPWATRPEDLRAAVRALIEDDRFRLASQRVMDSYAACDAPKMSAGLLEELAATRAPVLRDATNDPWSNVSSR
jgi:MGT family glycosyltransferase